jgi:hypothetical protein
MVHIIDVSNRAYEAREAAVSEMARLKQQADREHQVFEGEFRELGRLIEHDRKMRDFMKLKSKDQEELMRASFGEDGHKKSHRVRHSISSAVAAHGGSGQLVNADKGQVSPVHLLNPELAKRLRTELTTQRGLLILTR